MKVGVIGLGGMGRHHARVLKSFDFVDEVIGCDLDAEMRKIAGEDGLEHLVENEEKLLALEPAVVFVITHPAAHAACIKPAFEAGISVFTEKPLAGTLEESRELVAEAEKRGLNFQVGFELRYCGMTRAMKEIADSGRLGETRFLRLIQVSGPKPGGMKKEKNAGIFYEKLCHQLDMFRFWLGEPTRLMAHAPPIILRHYSVPDNVNCCVEFPGNKYGFITFTTTRAAQVGGENDYPDRGHFYEWTVTFDKGTLAYNPWSDTLDVVRFNSREDNLTELEQRIQVREKYGEPVYDIETQDADFLKSVLQRRPPSNPASDALKTMELVELAEESLRRGGEWLECG